jgi:hypothetical protein
MATRHPARGSFMDRAPQPRTRRPFPFQLAPAYAQLRPNLAVTFHAVPEPRDHRQRRGAEPIAAPRHGSGSAFWDECVPLLQSSYHCIACDLRSAGQSPAGTAPVTIDDHARDLIALLDKTNTKPSRSRAPPAPPWLPRSRRAIPRASLDLSSPMPRRP